MANNDQNDNRRRDSQSDENTTYSGSFGERNRNTPGRTPRELGLDPDEMRGHDAVGSSSDRAGDFKFTDAAGPSANRTNPPESSRVETMDGGLSASGGKAGGARGNSGTSDQGAGGPTGESRGGPGEYKSTSRGDLDHGTVRDRDDAE